MKDIFNDLNEKTLEHPCYIFNYLYYPDSFEYKQQSINFKIPLDKILAQFKKPEGIETIKFIAIGNKFLDEDSPRLDISDALKEIELTGETNNETLLDDYFGYKIREKWGELSNIKFIPYKFSSTHSIFLVKNILSNYLFGLLPNNFKFTLENSFLFTFKDGINSSKNQLLSILNKKYIEGNLKFSSEILEYELSNYFFPKEIIDELSKLNIFELVSELEDKKYDIYFQVKDSIVNCGYRIQDKNQYEISSLPIPINYLELPETIFMKSSNIKTDSYTTNFIIRDLTNSNEFYFYILNNLVSITDSKFNINYRRFFPLVNEKNFKSIGDELVKIEDKTIIDEKKLSYNKISTIEEILEQFSFSNDTTKLFYKYLMVKQPIKLPNKFELVNIFNELKLSYDIPFIKFKDPLTKEMVYKVYKPITQVGGSNYLPIVPQDELGSWIKYNGFDIDSEKIVPLKANPRELSLKVKLIDYVKYDGEYDDCETEMNVTFLTGQVKRLNQIKEIIESEEKIITTYDIAYEDIIIPNVKPSFIKGSGEYNVGDTVEFQKSKSLYIDINISIKGSLTIIINLSDLKGFDSKINLEKLLIDKLNYIINDQIFNLECLNPVKNFQTPIRKIDYQIRGSLKNVKAKLCQKKLKNPIAYSKFYSLFNIFYPYLLIDETAYRINEEIEFFNGTIWVNATVKEYISDKIKITIFDPKRGIRKEEEQIVDRKLLRNRENSSEKNLIDFRYKRVSNFEGGNAIRNLIMKLNNLNVQKTVILDKVVETFGISRELALKKLGDIITTEGKTLEKIRGNIGIGISLNWIIKPKQNYYRISLDNIESLGDLAEVIKLINLMFEIYDFLFNEVENDSLEIYRKDLESFVEKNIKENIEEQEKLKDIEQDSHRGFEEELFRETEGEVLDIFADFEIEEEEIIPLEDVENEVRKDIDREYRDELKMIEGKKSGNNLILEKLYEVDPELFDWKVGEGEKTYSKVCQSITRYPKVLSDENKIEIDEIDKTSYATDSSDIDCFKEGKLLKSRQNHCKAIKYGSNPENQYWYICPRIWDTWENKPLTIKDILGELTEFESLNPKTSDWRVDKKTGKDITAFNPTYKGRTYFREGDNRIVPTPTKSILLMPSKTNYSYPGFLSASSHPKSKYVPCCFQSSVRVAEAFDKLDDDDLGSNKYIQGWGKLLGPKRIGLLPPKLQESNYFNIKGLSLYTSGEMAVGSKAPYRRGILGGNDLFFNLVADILSKERTPENITVKDYSADFIKNKIVEELNEEEFLTLNRGNLNIWFMNNSESSSFQNYIEYTLSDSPKEWVFYYDLVTRPGFFFPKGLNMVIIEYQNEEVNFICTKSICEKSYGDDAPIVLVFKYKDLLEPIYYFKREPLSEPSKETVDSKNVRSLIYPIKFIGVEEYRESLKLELERLELSCNNYNGYTIVNKKFSENHNSILGYNFSSTINLQKLITLNLEIKTLIRDNYNKLIGVILDDNIYIPLFPEALNFSINKPIKNIDELKEDEKLSLDELKYAYKSLAEEVNEPLLEFIPIIFLYQNYRITREKTDEPRLRKGKYITGFICQYGLVIPIKTEENKEKVEKVISYIESDKAILKYREELIKAEYVESNTLQEVLDIFDSISEMTLGELQILRYIVNKDQIIGLVTISTKTDIEIFVPIIPINIRKGLEKLEEINVTDSEDNFEIDIDIIDSYLEECSRLKRLSSYGLNLLPKRGKMDIKTKTYNSIILETGNILTLSNSLNLNNSKDRKIIKNIIQTYNENTISTDLNFQRFIGENEMVTKVLEINYKKNSLASLRLQIANFLNRIENRDLKNLIKELLNDFKIDNEQKLVIIKVIIKFLFSVLVKETSEGNMPNIDVDVILSNLNQEECNDIKWAIFDKQEIKIELPDGNEFMLVYIEKLDKILNKNKSIKNRCLLKIQKHLIPKFVRTLSEDLIRNNIRREQILENKNLKERTERYSWNKTIEVFFDEKMITNLFLVELYKKRQLSFFTKYFGLSFNIEVPKNPTDSRPISFKILYRIGKTIKNIEVEEVGGEVLNRNRVNFQFKKIGKELGPVTIINAKDEKKVNKFKMLSIM